MALHVGGRLPALLYLSSAFIGDTAIPRTPPLGWSSWYAVGQSVDQQAMEETFHRLASFKNGGSKSLRDVGYKFANLDDGWQACGKGVNGSFHDANGYPLVDPKKFPNVTAMTALAHALGLRPGFYVNNYICGGGECYGGVDGAQYRRVMHSTVDFLKRNRFEYLKVDSGGCYNDMQLWHDLIEASGHSVTVENCHQGGQPPNATWCPFDLWRVGGDVNGLGPDNEILRVIRALEGTSPRTGCWPYPDFMSLGGDANQSRALFGLYAIMGTPMIMSFDIRDDSKLLPLWDILTNEEVIAVNQDATSAVGILLRKFSVHPPSAPVYAWAGECNASDPLQIGWSYHAASKRVQWQGGLCLDVNSKGGNLALANCSVPSTSDAQSWIMDGSRLWHADSLTDDVIAADNVGSLSISRCKPASDAPGQQWSFFLGDSLTTNVQVNLSTRMGGCWEITACDFKDGADVGTTFGCKGIPSSCKSPCDCNGAWAFNANGTITSVMSGKCLEVDTSSSRVQVSACTGRRNQLWKWAQGSGVRNGPIESVVKPGYCVDDGDVPAPPGTDGSCVQLSETDGEFGPGLSLMNPSAGGSPCVPSRKPSQQETMVLKDGMLKAGNDCVAGRHGRPSAYGPLQLWAKPLVGGAVAVLLAHRGTAADAPASVDVQLTELPGLQESTKFSVRDVWKHKVVDEPRWGGHITLSVTPQASCFYIVRPLPDDEIVV